MANKISKSVKPEKVVEAQYIEKGHPSISMIKLHDMTIKVVVNANRKNISLEACSGDKVLKIDGKLE